MKSASSGEQLQIVKDLSFPVPELEVIVMQKLNEVTRKVKVFFLLK